jgi:outer membrane protein assembly factor BamA
MRFLLIFMMVTSMAANCYASPDDTLPKGISSRFLAFPFFIRSPETNWGFGAAGAYFFKAGKNEDSLRTSDVNLVSLYTLRKQIVVVLGSTIFFPGENKIFRLQSSYSYYPDKFWGIGNESKEENVDEYSLKQLFFNPQLIFRVYKKFFIGLTLEMQDVRNFKFTEGGVFETQNIEGRFGGFTSGGGLLITWDTRNNAYSPSHGAFAELNVTSFNDLLGSDFNFTTYIIDLRKFIPLGRNRVLGGQAYTRMNDGNAPLRYMSMLGGTELMRGYYKGRFTDKNLIGFQAELRQYLFWRLGLAGFVSAGQVAPDLQSYGLNDFHYAYGGGIRLMLHEKEKLNLRVDFGFGKDSHGVYVILKEAF